MVKLSIQSIVAVAVSALALNSLIVHAEEHDHMMGPAMAPGHEDGHDHGHGHMDAPAGAPDDGHGSHGGHGGHSMGGQAPDPPEMSMSGDMPTCATDPTTADCASYVYPDDRARADAELNCEMMPFMVGCNVLEACDNGDLEGKYCEPFHLLAATCKDMGMSGMGGCAVYTRLCLNEGSVVEQCMESGIPGMVSTRPSQSNIIAECSTHEMAGCDTCTAEGMGCPNTLQSLQTVCNYHRMEMCDPYFQMCEGVGADLDHFCVVPGTDNLVTTSGTAPEGAASEGVATDGALGVAAGLSWALALSAAAAFVA